MKGMQGGESLKTKGVGCSSDVYSQPPSMGLSTEPVPLYPSVHAPNPVEGVYMGHPAGGYQQYLGAAVQGTMQNEWNHGICTCCTDCLTGQDCNLCCSTCCFPCITFGRNAEMIDHGAISWTTAASFCVLIEVFTGFAFVYSCTYRDKLRRMFGLREDPCCDICVHCCCLPCALCQEYKELRSRGLDPMRGWPKAAPGVPVITSVCPPVPPVMMQ
jgi:Cys-rich protein (TIGR01571 family)